MINTDYTKKEFEEQFPDAAVRDFFKHTDRATSSSSVNFYELFGVPKDILRAENGHNYSIPFELAPLLVAMIHSFNYAYGKDRRGHRKSNPETHFSYDDYHDYIENLTKEIEQLEPYQRALIENTVSYRSAQISAKYIPMVAERFTVLLLMLFRFGNSGDIDFMDKTIDYLDHLIENMVETYGSNAAETGKKYQAYNQYTFEKGISDVFKILSGISGIEETDIRNRKVVSYKLVEVILAAKKKLHLENEKLEISSIDKDFLRKNMTQTLNQAYEEFVSSGQDNNKIIQKNFENEVNYKEGFWSAKSFQSRVLLAQKRGYQEGLLEVLEMAADYGKLNSPAGLKRAIQCHMMQALKREKMREVEHAYHEMMLFLKYKYELEYIAERKDLTSKEQSVFIDDCTSENNEFFEHLAKEQEELHPDAYRKDLCDYYERVITSPTAKQILDLFNKAFSLALPSALNYKGKV